MTNPIQSDRSFVIQPNSARYAYRLLARFGLPHLRTRHVRLFINDEFIGFYIATETWHSEPLIAKQLPGRKAKASWCEWSCGGGWGEEFTTTLVYYLLLTTYYCFLAAYNASDFQVYKHKVGGNGMLCTTLAGMTTAQLEERLICADSNEAMREAAYQLDGTVLPTGCRALKKANV